MTVRLILLAAAVLAAAASVHGAGPQPGRRPNVILIITDDQGFGDAGFNGNPVVRTPPTGQSPRITAHSSQA